MRRPARVMLVSAAVILAAMLSSSRTAAVSSARIAAGGFHTCYVSGAGGLRCWGNNTFGEIGDGTTTHRSIPTEVAGLSSGVQEVATPGYVGDFTCALTTGGGVRCWGDNSFGELGTGTGVSSPTPVDVFGLSSSVAAITAGGGGGGHACALTTGGGVKCWGYNASGQLGDGTTTQRTTPVDVVGLSGGVAAIAAGGTHTCALTTGGGVKCWGRNAHGTLGDGTTTDRQTPVDVTGLTSGVQSIAGGSDHTCAVLITGAARCWGFNGFGQVGDGTTVTRLTPTNVSGLASGVEGVSAGLNHSCAVVGGGVRCWGDNATGQVGDGTTAQRLTPVTVFGLASGAVAVTAGGLHTCALFGDGGAECWGSNVNGQLGDGTTTNRVTPEAVFGIERDTDGDGVLDGDDAFPTDPAESVDTDGDGVGNNADIDDDGDLQIDADEIACGSDPLDGTSLSLDFEGDHVPDCVDPDDDDDGVQDSSDAFPLNASEWVDTDSDGIGNNGDPDDDNDKIPDASDPFPLDPLNIHPIFIVNSGLDLVDAAPGNGVCATATGVCTLRAAVQEANALSGPDRIEFVGTTITLTIAGAGEDAAASGDLDVTDTTGALTIVGNGVGTTTIQGCDGADPACVGIDRIFELLDGTTLNLSGVTLRHGRALNGGALNVRGARLHVSDSELDDNQAEVRGGAIHSNGIVTVTGSVIRGNSAGHSGGGILNNLGASLTVTASTLTRNRADNGGAIFSSSGSAVANVTIANSTISDNDASSHGGGVYNNGFSNAGTYRITNTTFSGNTAAFRGGAILNSNGIVRLASVTLSENSAPEGAAIASWLNNFSSSAPVTLTNSIVANSTGDNCRTFSDIGPATITSEGYSLSDDASCAFAGVGDLDDVEAGLAPLADNGGPTLTHTLLGTSPAIDAGKLTGCTDTSGAALTTDQRGAGFPRAADGNGDDEARCDIGAIEGIGVTADTDGDGVLDVDDALPFDASESADTDGDGIGNNADADDDGDLQSDADEATCGSNPLDPASLSADVDGDHSPDCVDTDDDNDSVADGADAFPFNALEWIDTDGDGLGNNADGDDDNDGIADALDRNRTTGGDESAVHSSDYVKDASTLGMLTRNGWDVTVVDTGSGVQATVSGAGASPARLSACGGRPKEIRLDVAGEAANWTCNPEGTLSITAVLASPVIEVAKLVCLDGCFFHTLAELQTDDSYSTGSPSFANADSGGPIDVAILDDAGVVVGGYTLEPGEGVEIEVVIGTSGQPEVRVRVLDGGADGAVDVTVFDQTVTLFEGASEPTAFVPDVTPPVIGAVADIVAEATSPSGATVTFASPAVTDDVDPAPMVTVLPASGSQFPLGPTLVTVTATDAVGNSSEATFTVTVVDTTPPVIAAVPDQVLEATGPTGSLASFTATATDTVSTPVVSYSHTSGSTFPLGTTTVTVTAIDDAGNTASATFTVTVRDTTAPTLTVPADLVVRCGALGPDGRGCVKATDPAVTAWLSSASGSDVADATPTITSNAPSVFPIGFTTVAFTATDDAGNTTQRTARVQVVYDFGGFLPPLVRNGSAAIQQGRQGRTIPVKFQLRCANGAAVPVAVASIAVFKVLDAASGTIDTTDLTADAGSANNNGTLFRYDAASQQYIYNLSTAGWRAPATYRIIATLDDGTQHMVDFSLR